MAQYEKEENVDVLASINLGLAPSGMDDASICYFYDLIYRIQADKSTSTCEPFQKEPGLAQSGMGAGLNYVHGNEGYVPIRTPPQMQELNGPAPGGLSGNKTNQGSSIRHGNGGFAFFDKRNYDYNPKCEFHCEFDANIISPDEYCRMMSTPVEPRVLSANGYEQDPRWKYNPKDGDVDWPQPTTPLKDPADPTILTPPQMEQLNGPAPEGFSGNKMDQGSRISNENGGFCHSDKMNNDYNPKNEGFKDFVNELFCHFDTNLPTGLPPANVLGTMWTSVEPRVLPKNGYEQDPRWKYNPKDGDVDWPQPTTPLKDSADPTILTPPQMEQLNGPAAEGFSGNKMNQGSSIRHGNGGFAFFDKRNYDYNPKCEFHCEFDANNISPDEYCRMMSTPVEPRVLSANGYEQDPRWKYNPKDGGVDWPQPTTPLKDSADPTILTPPQMEQLNGPAPEGFSGNKMDQGSRIPNENGGFCHSDKMNNDYNPKNEGFKDFVNELFGHFDTNLPTGLPPANVLGTMWTSVEPRVLPKNGYEQDPRWKCNPKDGGVDWPQPTTPLKDSADPTILTPPQMEQLNGPAAEGFSGNKMNQGSSIRHGNGGFSFFDKRNNDYNPKCEFDCEFDANIISPDEYCRMMSTPVEPRVLSANGYEQDPRWKYNPKDGDVDWPQPTTPLKDSADPTILTPPQMEQLNGPAAEGFSGNKMNQGSSIRHGNGGFSFFDKRNNDYNPKCEFDCEFDANIISPDEYCRMMSTPVEPRVLSANGYEQDPRWKYNPKDGDVDWPQPTTPLKDSADPTILTPPQMEQLNGPAPEGFSGNKMDQGSRIPNENGGFSHSDKMNNDYNPKNEGFKDFVNELFCHFDTNLPTGLPPANVLGTMWTSVGPRVLPKNGYEQDPRWKYNPKYGHVNWLKPTTPLTDPAVRSFYPTILTQQYPAYDQINMRHWIVTITGFPNAQDFKKTTFETYIPRLFQPAPPQYYDPQWFPDPDISRKVFQVMDARELDTIELLKAFYTNPCDAVKLSAGSELYDRGWRYHLEEETWYTPDKGSAAIRKEENFEQGVYNYFDVVDSTIKSKYSCLEYIKLSAKYQSNPIVIYKI